MYKSCQQCNNMFPKLPSHSRKHWESRVKFCSIACYNLNKQGRIVPESTKAKLRGRVPWSKGKQFGKSPHNTCKVLSCLHCGANFEVKAYRLTAKFCSMKCSVAGQDNGLSTAHEKARHSLAYKQWRTAIFERDNYTCQECKTHGGYLNADHIKPFAFYPELRFELTNGRTLCEECHRQTDTFGFKAWRNAVAVVAQA